MTGLDHSMQDAGLAPEVCTSLHPSILLAKQTAVDWLLMQAADALDIAARSISFGLSYETQEEQDFQVDRLTFKILDMALRRADEFCQRWRPLLPWREVVSGRVDLEEFRNRSEWAQWDAKNIFIICSLIAFAAINSFVES